jgi:hypothetical protein
MFTQVVDENEILTGVFVIGVVVGAALLIIAASEIIGLVISGSVSGPLIATGVALKLQGK